MFYEVKDIIRDVRVALDENCGGVELTEFGDVETLGLDAMIRSKVEEGVRGVHLDAPVYLLEQGHTFGDSAYMDDDMLCGWVLLPDDFLRLVVFKMDDWVRGVYHAEDCTGDGQGRNGSRYVGIRGTWQTPRCVLGIRPEGRVLEFYSCRSKDARVAMGCYIPESRIWNDEIDVSERCYRAAVYGIGALTMFGYGDRERGNIMTELMKRELR